MMSSKPVIRPSSILLIGCLGREPRSNDNRHPVRRPQTSQCRHLVAASGRLVDFVASPETAPRDPDRVYARPDDPCEDGEISWRQFLLKYNDDPGNNPLLLYPAYQFYQIKLMEVLRTALNRGMFISCRLAGPNSRGLFDAIL